ncbi:helix-turn-helix domain-containing protein [Phosphitispora sp. TUW77]|uniref:helix-turn-helix domain-containing protein n=1 Tax=Phosphitispora sp. TUW77 TaxID=3152361 RepID=UPI003AB786B0
MNYTMMGERIRRQRLANKMTQEILAEKANISVSFLGQIERGERKPSLETIINIANSLGVTVDQLLTDSYKIAPKSLVDELAFLVREKSEEEIRTVIEVTKTIIKYNNKKD